MESRNGNGGDRAACLRQLSTAMCRNTEQRGWVATGCFDMITPFFDAEITFGRYGISQDRVAMTYY